MRDQLDRNKRLRLRWTETLRFEEITGTGEDQDHRLKRASVRQVHAAMLRKSPGGILTEAEFLAVMYSQYRFDIVSVQGDPTSQRDKDRLKRLFVGLDHHGEKRVSALDACMPLRVLREYYTSPMGQVVFCDRSHPIMLAPHFHRLMTAIAHVLASARCTLPCPGTCCAGSA